MIQLAALIAACPMLAAQLVPARPVGGAPNEIDGGKFVFVELSTPRAAVFEREVVPVTLRVGVEAEFGKKNLLQLFVQPLDVPVQVLAPWLSQPEGARRVREAGEDEPDRAFAFALGDEVVRAARPADVQRGGATYAVLELTREFLVERTGELRIPAPSARFACATRFEQDFFLESQPVDWQLARANGSELVLRVEPLPAAGRPTSFTGAVGRFSVRSETDAPEVDLRESLTVRLIVEGHGNTEFFDAPRLDRLHGFEVRGVLDGKSPTQRTLSYDLAVASPAVTEVPALEFAYFDPGELPSYRVLRTEPLPLSVRSSPMEPVGLGPSLEARGRVVELLVVAAILALLVVASAVFAWRKLQRRKREASQVP